MITLIFRKPNPKFNSIENVFNTIIPFFNNKIERIELPFENSGILNRGKNIIFSRKFIGNLIHITGHDHYLTFGLKKEDTILTIHDIEFINRNKGLKKFVLKKLWIDYPIKRVKMVTTVSEFSKSELLKLENYQTPIQVIHNPLTLPIEYSPKTFNQDCPVILHIGTKANKNLPRLIKALKNIKCHLNIIGNPTKDLVHLLEINNVSHAFKSNLTNQQMIKEYESCDILAFVSTYEGFGLPIIEAQAMGRTVITANVASMPEVAEKGALLVNPFDIEEIKKGLTTLIENKELRNQLIQLGLENVKRFNPKEIAKKYQELYLSIENEK